MADVTDEELAALRELEAAVRAALYLGCHPGIDALLVRLDAARRPTLGQVAYEARYHESGQMDYSENAPEVRAAWARAAAAVVAEHERRKGAL